MLAKKTAKNRIVLPKKIADQFPGVEHFRVRTDGNRIFLEPASLGRSSEVRERLSDLDISEDDVGAAVDWARRSPRSSAKT